MFLFVICVLFVGLFRGGLVCMCMCVWVLFVYLLFAFLQLLIDNSKLKHFFYYQYIFVPSYHLAFAMVRWVVGSILHGVD